MDTNQQGSTHAQGEYSSVRGKTTGNRQRNLKAGARRKRKHKEI